MEKYEAKLEWEWTEKDFEDDVFQDFDETDRINYVKEEIVKEIMTMDFGSSNDLFDAITVTVSK